MIKLIAVMVTFLALFALSGCGDAGKGVAYSDRLISPEKVYEVDGWGLNPDIYEFTPVGHQHMTCLILVSGKDDASGIECFPKAKND